MGRWVGRSTLPRQAQAGSGTLLASPCQSAKMQQFFEDPREYRVSSISPLRFDFSARVSARIKIRIRVLKFPNKAQFAPSLIFFFFSELLFFLFIFFFFFFYFIITLHTIDALRLGSKKKNMFKKKLWLFGKKNGFCFCCWSAAAYLQKSFTKIYKIFTKLGFKCRKKNCHLILILILIYYFLYLIFYVFFLYTIFKGGYS